jgi:hypothetical protein
VSNLASARSIAEVWMASILPAAIVAAGGTGVYRHPAPDDAVEPFTTVQLMAGHSVKPLGRGNPGVERLTYDVSAWDAGLSAERVADLAAAACTALEITAPVSVTGGQIVSCQRTGQTPAPPSTIERGTHYQRDGGLYELMVKVD